MKRYTIFGGGGYIGNYLCRMILNQGDKVHCVDNFFKGHCDALLSLIGHPNFSFARGDVTNLEDCIENIQGSDYIVHLAGLVGFPICKRLPKLSYMVNVEGTKNVVDARDIIDGNIRLFFASTGSVYGKIEGICTEDSNTNPQSIYGIHKLKAEKYVCDRNNTLAYRFATCCGISPSMRVSLLVNDLVEQAINSRCLTIFEADNYRTFINIEDFCRGILFGLSNMDKMKYNVYNCGDDNLNWTKRQLAEYISQKTGCVVNYNDYNKDDDLRDYKVSYQRINDEGFKCIKTMEETIDDLIKAVPVLQMRNPYA